MANIQEVKVRGKKLKCTHCDCDRFYQLNTRINRRWLSVFDAEGFGEKSTSYVCENCGCKHEFVV